MRIKWTAFLLLTIAPTSVAAQDKWQFGSTPSFSSGKYGTETTSEVLYTPFSARRLFDQGDVSLVVPMTCVWGDSLVIINGSVVGGGGTNTATRSGRSTPVTPEPEITNECGLGDIVVRGRYYVVDEHSWWPTVALRGHLKAPTASAEKGLGTGKADEGIGAEVSRTIGRGTLAMIDGGYTVIGNPAGVAYNNNWWYDVGVGQDILKSLVNISVFFEEDSAIVPGYADARDILATVTLKGSNGWRFYASGEFGLSDGAPDRGFVFGTSRRF